MALFVLSNSIIIRVKEGFISCLREKVNKNVKGKPHMETNIALLRGINVGGHNKIKMDELKRLFESLGLQKVKTYIQSGNVLFESNDKAKALCQRIEREIATGFGYSINVMLRTAGEMDQIIKDCPYRPEHLLEGESIHVCFLSHYPSQEAIDRVMAFTNENEDCHIKGREVYLFFRESIRHSKLAKQLQKLEVPGTMRNWNTVNKLAGMAKKLE
jgi:uncharacterized protein (DUF1697 family)